MIANADKMQFDGGRCLYPASNMHPGPAAATSGAAVVLLQAYLVLHWAIMPVHGLVLPYRLFVCIDSGKLGAAGEATEAFGVEIEAQQ